MRANLEALAVLQRLETEGGRPATAAEQQVLARWSSWGAVPQIFDETRTEWATEREHLALRLDPIEYAAARRTTINAHYTDAAYVRLMWDALGDLGFAGGRVLEPGCGSGTFIGMAPPATHLTGVELDPTTARIAAALYPQAEIHAESFADTRLPDGHFDVTIGNVPFADVVLHDPRHNRAQHRMHNHFIVKALNLTRPGGLVAVLSSHFTLDAQNPAARRDMNALADLVGAVRLPSGAHRRAAGTEVVTDLLIFRRRGLDEPIRSTVWETVTAREIDGEVTRVNSYFDEHPDHILGDLVIGSGMYGQDALLVKGELDRVEDQLRTALGDIAARARREGLVLTPPPPADQSAPAPVAHAPEGLWDGHLSFRDGRFFTVAEGLLVETTVPKSQHAELRALLSLRDTARSLLSAEAASLDETPEIDELRAELRAAYAAYIDQYGPINRFQSRRTGRVDPATGEERTARVVPPAARIFRADPFSALVRGLEVFDDTTGTAVPATIMTERVVVPRAPVRGVDTAEEALAVVLDTHGHVDLDHVADLLGVDPATARTMLGELVYTDPGSGHLVAAEEYLSGNVRTKLEEARSAAEADPDTYRVNVDALTRVQPKALGPEDIEARLGAAWIDVATHRAFIAELLGDDTAQVERVFGAIWEVKAANFSVAATSEWGTERMPAGQIIKACLEQRPVQVTDEDPDGRRVVNPVETAAAQEKAVLIQERFAEWVWEDPERADRLQHVYNERFNAIVLRDYTGAGERLTLPGLARTFTPRPHQRSAVARMLAEPAVGLFHEVGAGKTAEMVMGAMELRRLGMVSKPCVVVPNHMLEQFTREWLQLYPTARILAASSEDLRGDARRVFVARAATNDWDAIIMTRTAFERIPVSPQVEAAYMRRETEALRAAVENSNAGQGLTVKRLEKKLLAAEERLAERLDGPADVGVTFEETGIDYLVVDELHEYKNLRTITNIRDAAIDGSRRASDLHMKLEYLRERHGDRVVTGATATPIANSVTEAHVMQRLLRPDLLEAAGVDEFDVWAATFGQTVTEIEMGPTGGYRLQTRLAKFQNVPEMLRLWHTFADVKTGEDLQLPTPDLVIREDGERAPDTVVVPPPPELSAYMAWLAERAEKVRSRLVERKEDNMLKISTDGRKAALDLRMVAGRRPSTPSKLDVVAEKITRIWSTHRDAAYVISETGSPSPTRGALQLVFCDLGTPGAGWNAYDELRLLLTRRGIPREQIRFIHEASNDTEKGRLFAACRAGQVAVLIGSTQKMGVGTNVQARAVALHHVDCPWRPADLSQRDGRILRQGNQNAEVGIYRYVVEGSFDGYSWQTVERKAKFISQVMRGRLDVREIDDIGDNALSFAEVKALAAGDPLILEQAQAVAEETRLERLSRAHGRQRDMLRRRADGAASEAATLREHIPIVAAAVARTVATGGDAFRASIGPADAPRTYTKRVDVAAALADAVARHDPYASSANNVFPAVCTIGGHTIAARITRGFLGSEGPQVEVRIDGVPHAEFRVSFAAAADPHNLGMIRKIENRITELPTVVERLRSRLTEAEAEQAEAVAGLDKPFKHAEALAAARARVKAITEKMNAAAGEQRSPRAPETAHADQPETTPPSAAAQRSMARRPTGPGR